jgi:anti-anti-sigma factor
VIAIAYIRGDGRGKAMLVINRQDRGDVLVFRCVGRIVAGEEVAMMKKAVLCHQSGKVLMLDLSEVFMIDGAGLGLLAFLAGWTRVVGMRLKLLSPSPRVQQLLQLTNLDSVLEICDSECWDELMAQAPIAAYAEKGSAAAHS